MPSGPLTGLRILDLSRLLPGPMCTLHLADMGADVIKIEEPTTGDYARNLNPASFQALNRNKRSLVLDLKSEQGRDTLLRLARTADALVESFRPGVMDRLNLGPDVLAAVNPRLVYCSLTGFGQTGPLAGIASHDINYLALAGVLDQTGTAGGPPALSNFQIADLAGGALTAAMAICAALVEAIRTGRGRRLDVAMADSMLAHQVVALAALDERGPTPRRGEGDLTGGLPCYGLYRTADDRWLAVGALEPKFWQMVCDRLGRPDLVPHGWDRGPDGQRAKQAIADIVLTQPLAHWAALFEPVDCCVSPVLRLDESLQHPHFRARHMVVDESMLPPGTAGNAVRQFARPVLIDGAPFGIDRLAPQLGQHTNEILTQLAESPDR